jgi:uncharacterized membrane protein
LTTSGYTFSRLTLTQPKGISDMTGTQIYLTVLRIIHIFSAVTWVGGGIFLLSVLTPTVRDAGPDGGRFMLQLSKYGRLGRLLTISSVLTVLAGLLLYYPTSGGLNSGWLKSINGITLTIGAIIGILALLHGAFATGPITRKMEGVAKQILDQKGPPAPELMQQAQALGIKLGSNAGVSVGLAALALLFMAAAQTI